MRADRLRQHIAHVQAALAAELHRRLQYLAVLAAGHNDMRGALIAGERTQQLDAVGAGHLQVEHDDGRVPYPHRVHEGQRIGGDGHLEPAILRDPLDHLGKGRLIIDHQQPVAEEVFSHDLRAPITSPRNGSSVRGVPPASVYHAHFMQF